MNQNIKLKYEPEGEYYEATVNSLELEVCGCTVEEYFDIDPKIDTTIIFNISDKKTEDSYEFSIQN